MIFRSTFLLISLCFLYSFPLHSQEFKWIQDTKNYVDHMDAVGNVYIADAAFGKTDIDFSSNTVYVDINVQGTYLAKYDTALALSWYKTDRFGFEGALVNTNLNGEIYALARKRVGSRRDFYLQKYTAEGAFITEQKAFSVEQVPGTSGDYRLLNMEIDSNSNVFISADITGMFSIANSSHRDTIHSLTRTPFLAKFSPDCNLDKVIRYFPNSDPFDILEHMELGNVLIDTSGTFQCLVEESGILCRLSIDTNAVSHKHQLFSMNDLQTNIRQIPLDDGGFMVLGSFSNAKNFNSFGEEDFFLSPKGSKDIFFAMYNSDAELQHVWQLGGSGAVELGGRNPICRNNYLVFGVSNYNNVTLDADMGSDTLWLDLSSGFRHICFDMSSFQTERDTFNYDITNKDLVADIFAGPAGSQPMYFVDFNDTLFFVANDGISGFELWKSDGSSEGTTLLSDINTTGDLFTPHSSSVFPYNPLVVAGSKLYLYPDTLGFERSLYELSSGSTEPQQISDSISWYAFCFEGKMYTRISTENPGLFLVSGAGNSYVDTFANAQPGFNYKFQVKEDSILYFTSFNHDSSGIWSFDGEKFSSMFYVDKCITGLGKWDNRFWFYELKASYNPVPVKFCSMDISGDDYQEIFNMADNTITNYQGHYLIERMNDRIIFTGYEQETGLELYTIDSITEQTSLIKDINPDGHLKVNNLVSSTKGLLFFSADNGHGNQIFQSDGTATGTFPLRGLNPFGKVNYNSMCIVKDVLYFGAVSDYNGSELWKYNFVTKLDVDVDEVSYSGDSAQTTISLDITVHPETATDTTLDFSILEAGGFDVAIDSLGNVTVNSTSKKSTSLSNRIKIKIMARDGSLAERIIELTPDGKIFGNTDLEVDAGPDAFLCLDDVDEYFIGGNPTAIGGGEPYTYSWSCKHISGGKEYYASSFLNDTTLPNPIITSGFDTLTFRLEVRDELGNISTDSLTLIASQYVFCLAECYESIYEGDSVKLHHCVMGGIPPYIYFWEPAEFLSDPTAENPWVRPPATTTYTLTILDAAGCIASSSCTINVFPLGVNSTLEDQEGIRIYPIPSRNQEYLSIERSTTAVQTLKVYNTSGIHFLNIVLYGEITQFSTKSLPPGLYLYRTSNQKGQTETGRFIIN